MHTVARCALHSKKDTLYSCGLWQVMGDIAVPADEVGLTFP